MANTKAPERLEPISDWDHEPTDAWTTPGRLAGSVAWNILTHSQGAGPDITRMIGPEGNRRPLPEGFDSEDAWAFVYELIEDAGEIGYTVAQIETRGFALPWETGKLRCSDLSRAVAALLRIETVETDEAFDPEWLAKANAPATGAAA